MIYVMRYRDRVCYDHDHVVFHIGIKDIPSNKTLETTGKLILDLERLSKTTTCDVSIWNTLIRIINNNLPDK